MKPRLPLSATQLAARCEARKKWDRSPADVVTCGHCGQLFERTQRQRVSWKQFCSDECKHASRVGKPSINARVQDRDIELPPPLPPEPVPPRDVVTVGGEQVERVWPLSAKWGGVQGGSLIPERMTRTDWTW